MPEPITFGKPPINEVVLGRNFLHRPDFLAPYHGIFWAKIRDRFPKVEHVQPIYAPHEMLQLNPLSMLPRVWYVSQDEALLVQLQQNRFYYNWRSRPGGGEYPRFPQLLKDSQEIWAVLDDVVGELTGIKLQTIGGEITYVNYIDGEPGSVAAIAQNSLRDFFWNEGDRFLPPPAGFNRSLTFPLPDGSSTLEVVLQPAKNMATKQEAIKLELAVRGPIIEGETYDRWIVKAHDFLVAGFKDLTSSNMHSLWELRS
ncbi:MULTISPECIES: TIGR04255 family protein [unclassified Variovorax]|uniref:TIGR04255 family protein n=1 Tax=unclassified Variovorax TaxID=663243 RepID=UPI0009FC595D|nr:MULTISPECIES: TIGR04255 family protein [unclassified Variovorax]PNG53158.1 hypothetical protein CHC06_04503 [Variovorax sp. B2]PNG53730.1 hypothetical protein CHC07_03550 [Variovorax sp. B4]VTV11181.1 hypothetical protein WDL1CHR_02064 [Variovorax sp. WDL1]